MSRLFPEHRGDQGVGLVQFVQCDQGLGEADSRPRVVFGCLRDRDPQLAFGIGVLPEIAQQLSVVLPDARPIGLDLEHARELARGDCQAAKLVGHRGKRAVRERIGWICSGDGFDVRKGARQPGPPNDKRLLQPIVKVDVRSRVGQRRIVERAAPAGARRIPEAAQTLLLLGGDAGALGLIARGREPIERALQLGAHLRNAFRLIAREISLLCRILREVVELRLDARDKLPVILYPPAQHSPAAAQSSKETLAIQRIARRFASRHQRPQVPSDQLFVGLKAE